MEYRETQKRQSAGNMEVRKTFEPWLRGAPTKQQLLEQAAKRVAEEGPPADYTDHRKSVQEQQPKKKGMNEAQKERLRGYMDTMKAKPGACVVCLCPKNPQQPIAPRPAQEFFTTPEVVNGHIELYLYGVCTGHTMLSNSDALIEKAVNKLKDVAKPEKPEKINLLAVTYNVEDEELKYA